MSTRKSGAAVKLCPTHAFMAYLGSFLNSEISETTKVAKRSKPSYVTSVNFVPPFIEIVVSRQVVDFFILLRYYVYVKHHYRTIICRKEKSMGNIKHKSEDKYDWIQIGAKIKQARLEARLTQSELMSKIGRSAESYRVLGRWEKGTTCPQFSDMIELCKVFDCELGYLLCESGYEKGKTRVVARAAEYTGLSSQVVEYLHLLHTSEFYPYKSDGTQFLKVINELCDESKNQFILHELASYLFLCNSEQLYEIKKDNAEYWDYKVTGSVVENLHLDAIRDRLKRIKSELQN